MVPPYRAEKTERDKVPGQATGRRDDLSGQVLGKSAERPLGPGGRIRTRQSFSLSLFLKAENEIKEQTILAGPGLTSDREWVVSGGFLSRTSPQNVVPTPGVAYPKTTHNHKSMQKARGRFIAGASGFLSHKGEGTPRGCYRLLLKRKTTCRGGEGALGYEAVGDWGIHNLQGCWAVSLWGLFATVIFSAGMRE